MEQGDDEPRRRMLWSLEGLSAGDAFGFKLLVRPTMRRARQLPEAPWKWSDDTHMALSVVEVLLRHGEIDQQALIDAFARRYEEQPRRGYGSGMRRLLERHGAQPWEEASRGLFSGQGSYGNGAAMRVPPLGAYFAPDLDRVVEQAVRSAEVTHAHLDGIAGAVAVAVAAGLVAAGASLRPDEFLQEVAARTPAGSAVHDGLVRAREIGGEELERAAEELGTGFEITAADTVPFCVWMCAHHLSSDAWEAALWKTLDGGNDADTTCAIVGGILAATAQAQIPQPWREAREPLPELIAS